MVKPEFEAKESHSGPPPPFPTVPLFPLPSLPCPLFLSPSPSPTPQPPGSYIRPLGQSFTSEILEAPLYSHEDTRGYPVVSAARLPSTLLARALGNNLAISFQTTNAHALGPSQSACRNTWNGLRPTPGKWQWCGRGYLGRHPLRGQSIGNTRKAHAPRTGFKTAGVFSPRNTLTKGEWCQGDPSPPPGLRGGEGSREGLYREWENILP